MIGQNCFLKEIETVKEKKAFFTYSKNYKSQSNQIRYDYQLINNKIDKKIQLYKHSVGCTCLNYLGTANHITVNKASDWLIQLHLCNLFYTKTALTSPKTQCCASKYVKSGAKVIKNCDPIMPCSSPTNEIKPAVVCLIRGTVSASKYRLDGPSSTPNMDSPPFLEPVGSPVWAIKLRLIVWNKLQLQYLILHSFRKLRQARGRCFRYKSTVMSPKVVSITTDIL